MKNQIQGFQFQKAKEEAKSNRQVKSQLFGSFRETFG